MASNSDVGRAGTQSLERGVALLRVLACHPYSGLTLTQASALSGLDISTTHRMLKALVRERLVARDADKRYALGMLAFELGLAAAQKAPLINEMRPYLQEVARRTGDTVYLVARSGDEAVCLAREEGYFPIRTLLLDVGGRRPLGLGAGSLHLLSRFPDDDVDTVIRNNDSQYARFHNIDARILRASVTEARRVGYGLSHSRLTDGVSGVGVALPADGQQPYAAIGVACISTRMTDAHCAECVVTMREIVERWHVQSKRSAAD